MLESSKRRPTVNNAPLTFRSLLKPYRARIVVILSLLLSANLLVLVLPWAIKIIIDDILTVRDSGRLNGIILILIAILVMRSVLNFGRMFLNARTGEQIVRDLRCKLFGHIPRLSLTSINRMTPAQILSRLTQDVDSVRRFLFTDIFESIYGTVNVVCITAVIMFINPKLAMIALLSLPSFIVVYVRLMPRFKKEHKALRELYGTLSAGANEMLNGIRTVRAFDKFNDESEQFGQRQGKILSAASNTHYLNAWLWVTIELFTSLGVIAVLWAGGGDVMAGRMTAGELVAFYTYLGMLFAPMLRLVMINASYQEASAALGRINAVMRVDDEIQQPPTPVTLPGLAGGYVLDRVAFSYQDGKPVFSDLSLVIEPGETVGIVGASGAGKTTLVSLLLRLFDPASGTILVDGQSLTQLDLRDYRQKVAVVLQDDFLFSGTIEDNIRYGRPDASLKEIIAAATIAQAHDFITLLKDNYKTEIGERGVNLSGGQRQRLAIARAMVKDPSVLILDEATSSVDALTENAIQRSVRAAMRGKTVLTVAHRFSTIADCDRIIVMDEGRIIEAGAHHDLLKQHGYYSNLYFEQFKEEDRDSISL